MRLWLCAARAGKTLCTPRAGRQYATAALDWRFWAAPRLHL
jgi:hypothetical protein